MKTSVICEKPLFELTTRSYSGTGEGVDITREMLCQAQVGQVWQSHESHACGRGVHEESLEVVYKTHRGCACLFREWGTTNEDNPESWENDPELIWFELIF
jgi:hypothetical protein